MLTRDSLKSGALVDMVRAHDPELRVLSDNERRATLDRVLHNWDGGDVWLFAYGSLIWNPAFHFAERRQGTVYGYHRQYCLWTPAGRGSQEFPGLMLGLERGGSCHGVAYRIRSDSVREELDIVWRREMITGAYRPVWSTLHNAANPVKVIAFVINRAHDRYAEKLAEDRIVNTLAYARGVIGSCSDYLFNTVDHLNELGIRDRQLNRLAARVRQQLVDEPPLPDPTSAQ
ncbi:MAG: gamma-glutamylcyclotransferase [Pseudomonadota bacterium]